MATFFARKNRLPLTLIDTGLVRLVYRRAVSEEVVAGTEIPGGGGRGRLYQTLYLVTTTMILQ